jgi:hypothetical protein
MGTNQAAPSAPDMPVPEPEVKPSSPPEGPQVVPSPSTPPGEPGPDPEPSPPPKDDLTGAPTGSIGVSSERVPADPGSIEGTGSRGTATGAPAGTWPTATEGEPGPEPDESRPHRQDPAAGPELGGRERQESQEWREDQPAANVDPVPPAVPGTSSGTDWQGVDRTVGEENPAEVPPHEFDRDVNPGHSHG